MTRISRNLYLAGVLLLSIWLLESSAFTSNTLFHAVPNSVRQPRIGRFVASLEQNSIRSERLPIDLSQVSKNVLESHEGELPTVPTTQSRLPWLMLFAALIHSHFFSSNSGADSVALSTVSATLLRSSRIPRWLSTQQLVAVGILSWQVALNLSNVLSCTQAAGTAFTAWYMSCLSTYPVYTKALTSGLIGLAGDAGAQLIEERIRCRKEGSPFQFRRRFDQRRAWTNIVDGIFVTGPMLHFSYNFLESLLPVSGAASGLGASLAALSQVLIDDFILDAAFVGIMFMTTGLGEGLKPRDILQQIRKDYVGAVKTSWATSMLVMPLEFMLFRFFPLSVRVLGMNIIDIIWEGMISYLVHKRRRGQQVVEGNHGLVHLEPASVTN